MEESRFYIPPDYSAENEHPTDEDDDWEDDDDMEDLEDEYDPDDDDVEELTLQQKQNELNKKLLDMESSSPFSSPVWGQSQQTPPWGTPSTPQTPSYPWQTQQPQQSTYGGWGQQVQQPQTVIEGPTEAIKIKRPKKFVICDALDILVESYTSDGRPNVAPRGIFDIKPKFDVWDKIASFTPENIIILFPSGNDSVINKASWKVALKWISFGLANYLRIPSYSCNVIMDSVHGRPKLELLKDVVSNMIGDNRQDAVYIGVYSGYWGLGSGDRIAAEYCGIDYADVYQLIQGQI